MSTSSDVREWHRYSSTKLNSYVFGDRIMFDRGTYSHWALYVGNGSVVHLNPADANEKVGPLNMEKWFPGAVTRDPLGNIAGNDRIRVVRVEGDGGQRPDSDIGLLIDITVGSPIFKYCLGRFNCEHFVNFLKFGKPVSSQILLVQAPLQMLEPSLFGGFRVNPMGIMTNLMASSLSRSRKKLKTRPESSDPTKRKRELKEICVEVARVVEEEPRDELEKYLFG